MEYLLQNDEASALVSPDLCCVKASSYFLCDAEAEGSSWGERSTCFGHGLLSTAGLVGPLRTATWLGSAESGRRCMVCTRLAADMDPSSSEAARRTSKEAKRPERHPVRQSGIGQCSGERRSLQAFRVRGEKRGRDALEEQPPQQVCLFLKRTGHLTCDLAIVREPNDTNYVP